MVIIGLLCSMLLMTNADSLGAVGTANNPTDKAAFKNAVFHRMSVSCCKMFLGGNVRILLKSVHPRGLR